MAKPTEVEDLFTKIIRTEFSADRLHRYWWEAGWEERRPPMAMLALNPSKADEERSDPTVLRCVRRAMQLGCGRLIMLNAFSWRDTDPKALYAAKERVPRKEGPERDRVIEGNIARQRRHAAKLITTDTDRFIREAALLVAKTGGRFLVGWGTHVEEVMPGRSETLVDIIESAGATPEAIVINEGGSPKHPLYCSYKIKPVPFVLKESEDVGE